jgi:hypothetical protein
VKLSESAQNQSQSLARELQALSLADRLIAVDPDDPSTPTPTEDQLVAAFRGTKSSTLSQIYWRATDFRTQYWRTDRARMSRVIPIFRALVAQDSQGKYHQNHGQLGFALKDQVPPAWKEAEAELSVAIRMRNRVGDEDVPYYRYYEFVRAQCRIALDPTEKTSTASSTPLRDEILSDLKAAALNREILEIIVDRDAEAIRGWLTRNGISLSELTGSLTDQGIG